MGRARDRSSRLDEIMDEVLPLREDWGESEEGSYKRLNDGLNLSVNSKKADMEDVMRVLKEGNGGIVQVGSAIVYETTLAIARICEAEGPEEDSMKMVERAVALAEEGRELPLDDLMPGVISNRILLQENGMELDIQGVNRGGEIEHLLGKLNQSASVGEIQRKPIILIGTRELISGALGREAVTSRLSRHNGHPSDVPIIRIDKKPDYISLGVRIRKALEKIVRPDDLFAIAESEFETCQPGQEEIVRELAMRVIATGLGFRCRGMVLCGNHGIGKSMIMRSAHDTLKQVASYLCRGEAMNIGHFQSCSGFDGVFEHDTACERVGFIDDGFWGGGEDFGTIREMIWADTKGFDGFEGGSMDSKGLTLFGNNNCTPEEALFPNFDERTQGMLEAYLERFDMAGHDYNATGRTRKKKRGGTASSPAPRSTVDGWKQLLER